MSDEPPIKQDRISIHRYYDRRDWAARLGITQTRLKEAVAAAGPVVVDVKAWLIQQIEKA